MQMMRPKRFLPFLVLCLVLSSCSTLPLLTETSATIWKQLPPGTAPATYASISCAAGRCLAAGQEATASDGSSLPLLVALSPSTERVTRISTTLLTRNDTVSGVSCQTDGTCWLVGNEATQHGSQTLILKFQNGTLRRVASPNAPAPFNQNDLAAVACPTPTSCWAVGQATDPLNTGYVLIEHLSTGRWLTARAPSTDPTGAAQLAAVSCTSPVWCVAAGSASSGATHHTPRALVETLSQGGWHLVSLPATQDIAALSGVSCPREGFCRAVGTLTTADGTLLPYLVTEAAGTWTAGLLAAGSKDSLAGISCPDVTVCYAVGTTAPANAPGTHFAARWTASGWKSISLPSLTGTSLAAISCQSASLCAAVGSADVTGEGIIFRSS